MASNFQPPALEIRHLRKFFGELVAVDDLSFAIRPGECVGLLGPNGAGKSTTVSMLAGLMVPTSGEILIGGRTLAGDTDPLKRQLGVVPQELAIYDELSARDNLDFFARLYSMSGAEISGAIERVLNIVGLSERARDKAGTFSGGMKRRLNLAAALLHDPQFLLLDEPTVGVDPQSRHAIFENIGQLRAAGKTILYTTHYMEEVEQLCDRVIIIDRGRVLADDTLDGLRSRPATVNLLHVELRHDAEGDWLAELLGVAGVVAARREGTRLSLELTDLDRTPAQVLLYLAGRGLVVVHLATEKPRLEAIFLTLTGRNLRDS